MMAVNTLAGEKKQSVPMVTLDKHVGEMDADELSETLLKSDNRYVKQIQIQDVKIAEKLFDDLMGSAVDPRRKYIEDHAEEANVEI